MAFGAFITLLWETHHYVLHPRNIFDPAEKMKAIRQDKYKHHPVTSQRKYLLPLSFVLELRTEQDTVMVGHTEVS